jgi:hypothetical protein
MTQMCIEDYGITARQYGEVPSLECRHEAHEKVDKAKRRRQIIAVLGDNAMTAKEVAHEMYLRGMVPSDDRNFSQPRLNEMCADGTVEQCGKKKCEFTGVTVTVYRRFNG